MQYPGVWCIIKETHVNKILTSNQSLDWIWFTNKFQCLEIVAQIFQTFVRTYDKNKRWTISPHSAVHPHIGRKVWEGILRWRVFGSRARLDWRWSLSTACWSPPLVPTPGAGTWSRRPTCALSGRVRRRRERRRTGRWRRAPTQWGPTPQSLQCPWAPLRGQWRYLFLSLVRSVQKKRKYT